MKNLPTALNFTERERTTYGYIVLLIDLSLPVSIAENKTIRNFSKHDDVFGLKNFKQIVIKLVEQVISRDVKYL